MSDDKRPDTNPFKLASSSKIQPTDRGENIHSNTLTSSLPEDSKPDTDDSRPPPYPIEDIGNNLPGQNTNINSKSPFVEPSDSGSFYAADQSYTSPSSSVFISNFSQNTPPSFSRPPSQDVAYSPFRSLFVVSVGKYLDKGFPHAPPPSNERPHPFITHDVQEADWLGFLDHIRYSATLTDKQIARSHLPIISIIPIVNSLVSTGVKTYMKSNKSESVANLVDIWNHHFFHPRKINVVLMKGQVELSGRLPNKEDTSSSNQVPPTQGSSSANGSTKGKGKAADDKDSTYRLFLYSI